MRNCLFRYSPKLLSRAGWNGALEYPRCLGDDAADATKSDLIVLQDEGNPIPLPNSQSLSDYGRHGDLALAGHDSGQLTHQASSY
jgi:hypothetical protein